MHHRYVVNSAGVIKAPRVGHRRPGVLGAEGLHMHSLETLPTLLWAEGIYWVSAAVTDG